MDHTDNDTAMNVALLMQGMQRSVNNDAALIERGRYVNTTAMLNIGEEAWQMRIDAGRIESLQVGPFVMPNSQFRLSAPAIEWQRFWQPVPAPGSHDLFAMLKRRVLKIDGDLHPLMSNLLYFKFVLAAPRRGDLQ